MVTLCTGDHRSEQPGKIHIYTGNGKGKTTAALGLALRAVGAGLKVHIIQFAKGRPTSEEKSLRKLGVTIRKWGYSSFIVGAAKPADVIAAGKAFSHLKHIIQAGAHDLVIIDEGNIALYYNMIALDELIALLKNRPPHVEVVITGRNAPKKLIAIADLVTEMREVKHYFSTGTKARKGIEE